MAGRLTVNERLALARRVQEATREALATLGASAGRDAVAAEALRIGDFSEADLEALAPHRIVGRHERLIDYQLDWALMRLERDGLLTEPEPEPAPPKRSLPRSRLLRRVLAR
jgi:hypothetical protein